ncbi:unnamed protein product [Ectocarpus sp. 12 AP-2014]
MIVAPRAPVKNVMVLNTCIATQTSHVVQIGQNTHTPTRHGKHHPGKKNNLQYHSFGDGASRGSHRTTYKTTRGSQPSTYSKKTPVNVLERTDVIEENNKTREVTPSDLLKCGSQPSKNTAKLPVDKCFAGKD